jgi:hypothetical protein
LPACRTGGSRRRVALALDTVDNVRPILVDVMDRTAVAAALGRTVDTSHGLPAPAFEGP